MRYVVDVPATWNHRIVSLAQKEGVSPRILFIWLIKCELEAQERLTLGRPVAPAPAEQAA